SPYSPRALFDSYPLNAAIAPRSVRSIRAEISAPKKRREMISITWVEEDPTNRAHYKASDIYGRWNFRWYRHRADTVGVYKMQERDDYRIAEIPVPVGTEYCRATLKRVVNEWITTYFQSN